MGLKKNFKTNFGSENFLVRKILIQNFFGTNKISGLKILGPKQIWGWKFFLGSKEIFEKEKMGANLIFGQEIIFEKNCGSRKNF